MVAVSRMYIVEFFESSSRAAPGASARFKAAVAIFLEMLFAVMVEG